MSCIHVSDDTLRLLALASLNADASYDLYRGDSTAIEAAIASLCYANSLAFAVAYGEPEPNPEDEPGPAFGPHEHGRLAWRARNPAIVLKAADAFEYQAESMGTDRWRALPAYDVLQRAIKSAHRRVKGYDDAPWGTL